MPYRGPSCRLCRREKMKLFLKGSRCSTPKCAMERRDYAPGMHGQGRSKLSGYGVQLREKQKVKRIYGLLEKQFKFYFKKASRSKGVTGVALLSMLERRLDNFLYRLGFVPSRAEGRQIVRHGHVVVNGKQVNIPSYQLKLNDTVEIKGTPKMVERYKSAVAELKDQKGPEWIELDPANFKAKVKRLPERSDVKMPIQEQLIIELYSK